MARPSVFYGLVIDYIHKVRGPFSLAMVRQATGIRDPKTSRMIINRLAAMHYVTYLTQAAYGHKRWTITRKWPATGESVDVVKDDYVTLQVMRRAMRGGGR